ncbi:ATP-binding protein [Azospirillum ramasamyi]|uniref:Endonuclease GajA/Old nuclease/RecF-like AAA domain-containing protein n=1 Tax=Azospirillum ramasamyi TaxID=682998 RepID=A0A2U9S7N3_9PROT|nr:ATP-binding protein [Azospirillum ramasamyi]AWU95550.1 hypothetical protein DM194_14680 [Azospirillum ramasamyi]
MKLKAVLLENFRGYRHPIRIPISNLTSLIGKNDAGKSTILEGLDIFFDGTTKIEPGDASVNGNAADVRIGCVFTDLPTTIDLDRGAQTTLAGEYLLNCDGDLEIHKVWDLSGAKAKAPAVFARANHPTKEAASGLLGKKQKDLQRLIKEHELGEQCDQTSNPSMRAAIYSAIEQQQGLSLAEYDVPLLGGDETKAVWAALDRYMPIFALFKSDRESSDQDKEVQDPMALAVKRSLAALEADLAAIAAKVEEEACAVANKTLEQLRASYPDLAATLTPKFRKPNWSTIFKLDLASNDDIPLNKRGSGVRRLVLLSFFQAEAARKRLERVQTGQFTAPVIYGVEEPETSQHPENQVRIIEALQALSDAGEQVILTTHVPGLAGLVPVESLRFVDRCPAIDAPRVRNGTDDIYAEIASALGVFPTAVAQAANAPDFPRVAVCVEGYTDETALRSLGRILEQAGVIHFSVDTRAIFWVSAGGSSLHAWVERRYLDSLGIPQFYLCDSDRTTRGADMKADTARLVEMLTGRPNCQVWVTRKREIENYLHPAALLRCCAPPATWSIWPLELTI